jgi:hypothetical protein
MSAEVVRDIAELLLTVQAFIEIDIMYTVAVVSLSAWRTLQWLKLTKNKGHLSVVASTKARPS